MVAHIGKDKIALVIEDDTIHRKLVKMRLQQMDFVVLEALHHKEADAILSGGKQEHEIRVDLIVSDNNTYEKKDDGTEKKYLGTRWIKKLRASASINKNVPTILHTASKEPAKREKEAMEAGADVFLHKVLPDDPDDAFYAAVKQAMNRRKHGKK